MDPKAPVAFLVNRYCLAISHGRAGRLTALSGGFWPGQSEKTHIRQLFSLFALVPEDTYLGPDAMRIMYNAVFPQAKPMSSLKLRMFTQALINRSLVIGTAERPQLHDIIRGVLRTA
jgi:hypothetical protein